MSKLHLLTALLLLLLIVTIRMKPSPVSASLKGSNEQQHRRSLQQSRAGEQSTVAMELISLDHNRSPFARPNITKKERALRAVQRSHLRAGSPMGKPVGQGKVFSSPVVYSNHRNVYGEYLMEITIGTPRRKLLAIADITVDLVTVTCQGCERCSSESYNFFNTSASSTYTQARCKNPNCLSLNSRSLVTPDTVGLQCPANGTDGECKYQDSVAFSLLQYNSSAYSILSKETLSLTSTNGSVSTFPGFYFGCGSNPADPDSIGDVQALVGLGQGSLSLVGQLGAQIGNIFSYCLVEWETSLNKTSPLLLGSAGPGTLPLKYTPLLTNIYYPTLYYINVLSITIEDKAVNYTPAIFDSEGGGGWVMDMGYTFSYIDVGVYNSFLEGLRSATKYTEVISIYYDLCFNISGVVRPVFPQIVFHLQDVNVTLPYKNIFYPVDELGNICLAINPISGTSYLGSIWQQNFQIAIDRENKKLGIAPTDCSLSAYH